MTDRKKLTIHGDGNFLVMLWRGDALGDVLYRDHTARRASARAHSLATLHGTRYVREGSAWVINATAYYAK